MTIDHDGDDNRHDNDDDDNDRGDDSDDLDDNGDDAMMLVDMVMIRAFILLWSQQLMRDLADDSNHTAHLPRDDASDFVLHHCHSRDLFLITQ